MVQESFNNATTKKELTEETQNQILRTLLELVGKEGELQSFLDRGQMGKPQRGDGPESFYMMSGIRGGARVIGLGKLEGRFVAYLSEGNKKMNPIEIEDQAGAAQLMGNINNIL